MFRRSLLAGCAAAGTLLIDVCGAAAQNPVKIGVVVPMTGPSAAVGREVVAGAKLYIQQHGGTIAGQKIELIIRDDAGVPEVEDQRALADGGLRAFFVRDAYSQSRAD